MEGTEHSSYCDMLIYRMMSLWMTLSDHSRLHQLLETALTEQQSFTFHGPEVSNCLPSVYDFQQFSTPGAVCITLS